jgi:hypothetical protein
MKEKIKLDTNFVFILFSILRLVPNLLVEWATVLLFSR